MRRQRAAGILRPDASRENDVIATTLTLRHGPLTFSALSKGVGPLVLCLHGFPDDYRSFRHQLPALAGAGYRAVSVMMRGYEPSSLPADGDYSMAALAGDVLAFMDDLGAERAHLVGHDWGAAVGYVAVAMKPERFTSLTTIAVPHTGRFLNDIVRHPKQMRLSWYMAFFQLRGVAERIVASNDFALVRKLWRDWSPGWDIDEDALDCVVQTLGQPGVLKAALGYYRTAISLRLFTPAARAANGFAAPAPTLAITGEDDGCIDSRVFEAMMRPEDFPGGLRLERIGGAGHFVHQEKPDAVNALLLDWLSRFA